MKRPTAFHSPLTIKDAMACIDNLVPMHTSTAHLRWNLTSALKTVLRCSVDRTITDVFQYLGPPEKFPPLPKFKNCLAENLEHRYSLQTWIDAEVEEEELIGNDSSTVFPVKPAEHTQQLSSPLHPVEVERENFDPPTKRIKLLPAVPIEKAATFVASTALDDFMRLRGLGITDPVVAEDDPMVKDEVIVCAVPGSMVARLADPSESLAHKTATSFQPSTYRHAISSHIFTTQTELVRLLEGQFKLNIVEREFPTNAIFLNASTCAMYDTIK
jgi:hypothetical protein